MSAHTLPRRLRRSESFFGIHFDFHAGADCKTVGQQLAPRTIEKLVREVKPDYLQCDCKGHPGIASYPTKVGHPAPGFVRDPLRIWRDVTARHGVALYMHYSGVWDSAAIAHHPNWARIDEKGQRDKNNTSVFGPYVDELLIPQLKELSDVYGVDGVWIDGDCWATAPDYGPRAQQAFQEATGIRKLPRDSKDPNYFTFLEFCREGFRRYVRRYVDALHAHHPRFQIASNWAFSSFMPEPASANVDFISGDYSMQDSVNAARIEGRCMANQAKPWDLMAWSFAARWEDKVWCTKSIPQLQREAAVVLALGGGFQAYFTQRRDASVVEWQIRLMSEVAKFCRARQKVCHRAKAVPQIALLYSGYARYRSMQRIFSNGDLANLSGVLNCLLESQNSVEVLSEHHLRGRMDDYPLIVIPEWECLEPAFREELLQYVRDGGNLLVIGPKAAALFEKELCVKLKAKAEERHQWLECDGWLAAAKTLSQDVKPGRGATPFGRLHLSNDLDSPALPAASIARLGKGRIAATYVNFGERYRNAATSVARRFLNGLVRELFPKPLVEVGGSQYVDVSVNRIDGKLAVNLVNTAGPHAQNSVYVFDEIPAVGPLQATIRHPKPRRVLLEPGRRAVRHTYSNGAIRLTLPRLEIHDVIVVE
jgi:hypothetical protein